MRLHDDEDSAAFKERKAKEARQKQELREKLRDPAAEIQELFAMCLDELLFLADFDQKTRAKIDTGASRSQKGGQEKRS